MTRNYRIIREKKSEKWLEIERKSTKQIAEEFDVEYEEPSHYIYWLSEIYYDDTMKIQWYSQPHSWFDNPKEILEDLEIQLKDAVKDFERWVSVYVDWDSIIDTNPLPVSQ